MSIQNVEINKHYECAIHCPFCGDKVLDVFVEDGDPVISPCVHTLFIASDDGFEYTHTLLEGIEDQEYEHIDELTNSIVVEDGVKFSSYTPAPSGMGSYVGFAPVIE
jgi:hypothetical protein